MSATIHIDPAREAGWQRGEDSILAALVELVALRCRRRIAWLEQRRERRQGVALDEPAAEQRFYETEGQLAAVHDEIAALERRLNEGDDALAEICKMFGLSTRERDLLITCAAVELEPSLGELYARLNGHPERRYATEPLAARLFGHGRQQLFGSSGPLATWGLVHRLDIGPGLPSPLTIDSQVLGRLRGQLGLDAELVGCAELVLAREPLDSWPLEPLRQRIGRSLAAQQPMRLILVGPSSCGRRSLAASLAREFGAGALAVDTDDLADETWVESYVRVARLATMAGLIPIWTGAGVDRRWPRVVPPGPLQVVICEDPRTVRRAPGVVDQIVTMPVSDIDERRTLWRALIPESAGWPAGAVDHLASRHRLAVGDIAQIGQRLPESADEARLMAREQTRGRLGELGRLLDCPFDWNDLILAESLRESLQEFSFEAAERVRFWETPGAKRLFPRGTGLVGMLTGPPGTGKTMASQVIAAELELDLFRINLATVISKYIGETAKNLDRIFTRASRMNAVLLFDEADSLFSKRTEIKDSHDRYANTDTNHLLQLLEEYQGIALLATNKKSNVDPAFIRRIRYVFDFRRPDANQRRTIWRRILRELVGPEVLRSAEPAVAVLAETVELTGAQIKNTVLAAIFIARRRRRPLGIDDLIRGLDRELGKEGRSLNDRERGRLRRHG